MALPLLLGRHDEGGLDRYIHYNTEAYVNPQTPKFMIKLMFYKLPKKSVQQNLLNSLANYKKKK